MCILSIELVWVENMEKWEKNHHLWAFSRGGNGTKQSGTGTISVLVNWYRYQLFGTGTQCSISD